MHIEELLGGPLALFCLGCSRLWLQIILQWEEIELYFCLISVRPNQKKELFFHFHICYNVLVQGHCGAMKWFFDMMKRLDISSLVFCCSIFFARGYFIM